MASPNYLYTNPEVQSVTPEQLLINQIAEKLLALKGWSSEDITFTCLVGATEFEERIKDSSLSALLLPEGASLLEPYPYGKAPKEDLVIGEAEIKSVDIRAFGYNVQIFDGDGYVSICQPNLDPDQWLRSLEINLWYGRPSLHYVEAKQILCAVTQNNMSGHIPPLNLYRDVYSTASRSAGYIGHNKAFLDEITSDHIQTFVDLANELFDARASVPQRVF
jgi:hypothetical protein